MDKKYLKLIALLIIILAFAGVSKAWLEQKNTKLTNKSVEENIQIEIKKIDPEKYKQTTAQILNEFWQNLESDDLNLKKTREVKNKLTETKTPKEYLETHMNLFIAVNDIEDYFENNDLNALERGRSLIIEEVQKNDWLNI